jgi:hypothetical protein
MAKWIIGIIIVVLLAGALWYSGVLSSFGLGMMPSQTATTTQETATTTQQAVAQPENGMAATNDASDAAITQDTAAVDAQMQGLGSDSAAVDSSLNDKQTAQSY